MLDASQLFSSPPSSIGNVILTVLEIFVQEWKTLMGLSALYLLSAIALGFTIGIFFAIFFAKEVASLMQFVSAANAGHRHLLDYSTGISGASRVLDESFSYGQTYYNSHKLGEHFDDDWVKGFDGATEYDQNPNALSGKFAVFPVIFVLLVVITLAFFASVFVGSLTHATGEVYAGNTPVLKNSLQKGWLRKWTVFAYQILVSSISFFIVLITFILPVATDIKHQIDAAGGDMQKVDAQQIIGTEVVYALIMVVVFVIFTSLLVASIPAMMIENKSSIEAFKRSIALCKGYLCFILCTVFCWNFLQLVAVAIVNMILAKLPVFVALIGHLVINVFTISIAPVISFVLYMSMRVRDEGLDQNQFANEIGSSVPIAEAVELNGGKYQAANISEDGFV